MCDGPPCQTHLPSELTPLDGQQKAQFHRQERFLAAFGRVGNVTEAAKASGVSRQVYYLWYNKDTLDIRERLQVAQRIHNDYIFEKIRNRLEYPKGNRGFDILLMSYAKGNNPAKWRELPPQDDSAMATGLLFQVPWPSRSPALLLLTYRLPRKPHP